MTTASDTIILAAVKEVGGHVQKLHESLEGDNGIRARVAKLEYSMPKQPCADFVTHRELHKQRERQSTRVNALAPDQPLWRKVLVSWLSPAGVLCTFSFIGVFYWVFMNAVEQMPK